MKKVLFVDTVHPFLWNELEKDGYQCIEGYSLSKENIRVQYPDIFGMVIRSRFELDAHFMHHFKSLKFIARAGSGMENIDLEQAHLNGIRCFNAAEGNRQAVAEHALGMLLSLFNNLNTADQEVRQGSWNRASNRGIELSGKTIGIIGFGNTGSALAHLLSSFDSKILAYDKYKSDFGNEQIIECDMQTIFDEADILSLHIPRSHETHHLVNNAFLNRFKKPIFLINTSRGACVNTADLLEALSQGNILGACLDVLEFEKISFETVVQSRAFQKLVQFKNVILSPHVAGWTVESKLKLAQVLHQKITSAFKEKPLQE